MYLYTCYVRIIHRVDLVHFTLIRTYFIQHFNRYIRYVAAYDHAKMTAFSFTKSHILWMLKSLIHMHTYTYKYIIHSHNCAKCTVHSIYATSEGSSWLAKNVCVCVCIPISENVWIFKSNSNWNISMHINYFWLVSSLKWLFLSSVQVANNVLN